MKKFVTILLSLLFSILPSMAQVNPKPGYIITNSGDTIRGILDFRTNKILAHKCLFQANGENEYKTYRPGDIECFRFDHNGKYFVTRRFNLYGDPQLYFAEFMVQGKMNLYCIADDYDEHFFFEREDGEMAQLTNKSLISSSAFLDKNNNRQEKMVQLGKVKLLLKDSFKALEDMNDNDLSRKKLVNVVRDYHSDVCTDGGTCMVYEYQEKSDKVKTHFKAFTGYSYYSTEWTEFQDLPGESYHGSVFEIGLGIEADLERVMKGGGAEIGIAYSPKAKFEHDIMVRGGHEPSHTTYERSRMTIALGIVKRFGNGRIHPLIRGGGFYVLHFGNHETRSYMSKEIVNLKWDNTAFFGVYLGVGVQTAVGKHSARLHGDWYKPIAPKGNMMKWGITAEFLL